MRYARLLAVVTLAFFAVLATVWLGFPIRHTSSTLIGHPPGTPEPNTVVTTLEFGWPLTWLTWRRFQNEARASDETTLGQFQFVNFALHVTIILAPLVVAFRLPTVPPSATIAEQRPLQFRLKTIVAATMIVASLVTMYRGDWISVVASLTLLFGLFLFAEDVWPWLPQ